MRGIFSRNLKGIVHIKIIGNHAELFINRCIANGIPIWEIKRESDKSLTAYLYVNDILTIRPILREAGCKIRFINKKGVPFLLKKMWLRSGLVIGILFFLLVLFILSNMIWNIEIEGAKPETEYKIEKALQGMGIEKGKFILFLPSNQEIQQSLSEQFKEITWIGVQLKGTTYLFDIVEKELPTKDESLSPRHLVAKKTGVITNMFVEQGQPMVKENDVVAEGEILISGIIGNDKQSQFIPAKGEVFAEVWYDSVVDVPLESTFNSYTGEYQEKHYLSLFGVSIPIWGFGKIPYKTSDIKTVVKEIQFLKWTLPISYFKEIHYEVEKHKRKYTKEEAIDVGTKIAEEEIAAKLSDDAKIKDKKIRHMSLENGKVNLKVYFVVVENITKESPIIKEID